MKEDELLERYRKGMKSTPEQVDALVKHFQEKFGAKEVPGEKGVVKVRIYPAPKVRIPGEFVHSFRANSSTHSDPNRPLIPI
jgi:hypothetical protein